ncbi:MAG: 2-keto-4-pentenoate hydratase [Rhodospirillaceae bacterium]
MLNQAELEAIAAEIFAQHENREVFRPIPDRIPTVSDAHDVQEAYVGMLLKKYGTKVGGYKVALTSKQTRDWLKVYEPCAGQVLATRIYTSPHTVSIADFVRFSLEPEVCAVLDKDMSGPCTPADVRRNLRSLHSAFELVEDRSADMTRMDAKSLASDNSWNAGIVIGPAASKDIDLTNRRGALKINGGITHQGTTSETMGGDPLESVAWLVAHLGKRGKVLRAGEPVLTGSITQSQFLGAGITAEFAMDGMPPVQIKIV